ncbi:MAG TPA: hypothetical protein LFW20_03115 [Rickettsia endosymbiont of Omalisus fontisbellaquei]|nr:hypothetical protein [Rickettsia endosymbiont of Omalisus fontisbellaquei]
MRKVIMQGPNVSNYTNTEELAILSGDDVIHHYLNTLHAPIELFINAHGQEYLQENLPPQLTISLFSKEDKSNLPERLAHNVLTKIAKNTVGDIPSIVHILSCHSGAAQHNLNQVEGDIVLCTYTKSSNTLKECISKLLFNRDTSLINFIVKNLPLLIATDFAISYKLNDNIYTIAFDHTPIKQMNLDTFSKFLQIQYDNVMKFYKELHQQYSDKYEELIPKYDFPETISYTSEKLKEAFNSILNINYTNLTALEIEHFLKIDNSSAFGILSDAIKQYSITGIELVLNNIEVNDSYLCVAIMASYTLPINDRIQVINMILERIKEVGIINLYTAAMLKDPAIFKILLNKVGRADAIHFDIAVKTGNTDTVQATLEKMVKTNNLHWAMKTIAKVLTGEEKATDAHAAIAIETGNPTIVEAVIEKTGVTYDLLKIASTTENQEIIDLVFNKFGTIPEWLLFDSISSMNDQSFTELLLNKMPQVSITAAYYALKVGNLEVIPEILKKVDINYDRNGDKEFCREIANEFSTEQNQEVTQQLEQYLVTLPEFNITNQLESKVISIIGDYLF